MVAITPSMMTIINIFIPTLVTTRLFGINYTAPSGRKIVNTVKAYSAAKALIKNKMLWEKLESALTLDEVGIN